MCGGVVGGCEGVTVCHFPVYYSHGKVSCSKGVLKSKV